MSELNAVSHISQRSARNTYQWDTVEPQHHLVYISQTFYKLYMDVQYFRLRCLYNNPLKYKRNPLNTKLIILQQVGYQATFIYIYVLNENNIYFTTWNCLYQCNVYCNQIRNSFVALRRYDE